MGLSRISHYRRCLNHFGGALQDEEYALFGKATKFAGIYGKEIRVIGKNREILTAAKAARVQ